MWKSFRVGKTPTCSLCVMGYVFDTCEWCTYVPICAHVCGGQSRTWNIFSLSWSPSPLPSWDRVSHRTIILSLSTCSLAGDPFIFIGMGLAFFPSILGIQSGLQDFSVSTPNCWLVFPALENTLLFSNSCKVGKFLVCFCFLFWFFKKKIKRETLSQTCLLASFQTLNDLHSNG